MSIKGAVHVVWRRFYVTSVTFLPLERGSKMVFIITSSYNSDRMVNEYGKYLLAQIATHPLTKGKVGKKMAEMQEKLKEVLAKKPPMADSIQEKERALAWINLDFYDRIRDFHSHLLTQVGYDRKDSLYQKYFPGGPTKVGSLTISGQVEAVKELLRLVEESGDSFGEAVERLAAVHQEMVDARKERAELEWNKTQLRREEAEAKEHWSLAYRETYFELMMALDHKKKVVEVFFKKPQSRTKKEVTREVEEKPTSSS